LLLAAAHAAGELTAPSSEGREGLEAELEVLDDAAPRLRSMRSEEQVLVHGQPREEVSPFGNEGDAELDDLVRRLSGEIVLDAVEDRDDAAGGERQESQDAVHERALAVPVGAEERDRLPVAH